MACGVHWKIRSKSDSISEGGGEQMGTDNRQHEFQMDIMLEGFLLEKDHRDDKDLARVCHRYVESIFETKSKK